ncbi:MAG TPA: hypothetical protein VM658_00815 [bacterium]|nr:hypothetical protein [bacterium]
MTGAAAAGSPDAPSFGSGIFGHWITEENGMPAYLYTMRHDDPRAVWDPKTWAPNNLQWHQLGNDRVVANAYNLGFVKLFYGESGAIWLNEYEPEKGEHAGGFGWIIDGATVLVDRDEMVPQGAQWERVFGAGYFSKRLRVPGLDFERTVWAPVGNLTILVSEVTIKNTSSSSKDLCYIEYWDVNMKLKKDFLVLRPTPKAIRNEKVRMIIDQDGRLLKAEPKRIFGPLGGFPDKPMSVDPELPALFVSSPDQQPETWITDPNQLFHQGSPIMGPAAQLIRAGEKVPDPTPRPQIRACLAPKVHVQVPANSNLTMRFIYGYIKGMDAIDYDDLAVFFHQMTEEQWNSNKNYWKNQSPSLVTNDDKFVGRELVWDYYYFLSSSLYDAYYQEYFIPQGSNYLYFSGGNGATRDYAAFAMTLAYYKPERARDVLTFMTRCQDPDGRLFYDLEGYGKRYSVPYRPGDLDLWFLWALSEYVSATRDFAFLDQVEPYYPLARDESGTVWDHAQRSLNHLVNIVGTGPRGNPRLKLSDWNDEMTLLTAGSNPLDIIMTYKRGESIMNTAMACYIMPQVRDLASARGDAATARTANDYLDRMRVALNAAWAGDHLIRSWSGLGKPYGDDVIFLEPQAWALLAQGTLPPEREKVMVDTIVKRLKEPSVLGMIISNSVSGSLTTRKGEQEEGGIWFAINGPAAVALSRFDQQLGWDEVKRNTLAWHASVYPGTWYGIWSGPDAWNSAVSDRPAETWYMKNPIMNTGPQMYPIQNAHAHCQTLWAIARLAGITPTPGGWIVEPRIPMSPYSFSCALYGIEVGPQKISGYVDLPARAVLTLNIKIPEGWEINKINAWVGGEKVDIIFSQDFAILTVGAESNQKVNWEITRN